MTPLETLRQSYTPAQWRQLRRVLVKRVTCDFCTTRAPRHLLKQTALDVIPVKLLCPRCYAEEVA